MRKIASIQHIAEVKPIPGADRICAYRINGWWVVDRVGAYSVGDRVVFIEPDAWVPKTLAPFLCNPEKPREFNGVVGEKLRTVRLKKKLSQGLLLPISYNMDGFAFVAGVQIQDDIGTDVSEALGIQKWEAPEPVVLGGQTKGTFPSFILKTDQERCQNLVSEIESWKGMQFEVTEKMEGSSATFFFRDGEFGVCSRNMELKEDDTNSFWKVARKYKIEASLREVGRNLAIQGELVGPSVQGNIYSLSEVDLFVFVIFDIDAQEYLSSQERIELCSKINLRHTPVLDTGMVLSMNVDELLAFAEGKSKIANTAREGVVFKSLSNPSIHFKAVSNSYLLKA